MTRRAIRRDEEASIRESGAKAIRVGDLFRSKKSGATWTVNRYLATDALWAIRCSDGGTIYESERDLLDPTQWTREEPTITTDVHQGADMGEPARVAESIVRPKPPAGFGWYEHGLDSYGLDEAAEDGLTIARVKRNVQGTGWVWALENPGAAWTMALSLPEAKAAAEDAARAARLFEVAKVESIGERVAKALGFNVRRVVVDYRGNDMGKEQILRIRVDGAEILAGQYDKLRAAGFDVAPSIRDDVPAFPPMGPARTLTDLFVRHRGLDEEQIVRLCEAFVSELRAAPPAPAPRTTDGALTAYLLKHHPEAWRPGEDALALAIRLLTELGEDAAALNAEALRMAEERNAAREEARVSDANAVELEELVRAVRAETDKTIREFTAERDEARADLAILQAGLRGLMAKTGAPHG